MNLYLAAAKAAARSSFQHPGMPPRCPGVAYRGKVPTNCTTEFSRRKRERRFSRDLPENLRVLYSYHSSIAEVCRRLGVNRSQFNRYLSGQTQPSLRLMHEQ